MKKISVLTCLFLGVVFIGFNQLKSNPTGAPAGYSGSPADGQTCGNCHGGTATTATNVLTSNVPTAGYTPGQSYTITVTIAGSSARKGFEVSPQNDNGIMQGTISSGNGSTVVGTKYVTHTSAKTSNPSTWTFTWTAPAKGTGTVNIYGAFVNGKLNVSKQVISVQEANSIQTTENKNNFVFNVFPIPAIDLLQVDFTLFQSSNTVINLISIDGKTIRTLFDDQLSTGANTLKLNVNDCKAGVYFLQINNNNCTSYKKIIIQ
jgi:hypothetical protein